MREHRPLPPLFVQLDTISQYAFLYTHAHTNIAHSGIIDACTSKKKNDICQDLQLEERGIGKAELGHRKPTGLSIWLIRGFAMLRLIWSILLDHLPRRESDRVGGQSGIKQSGDRPTFVRYSAFRGPPPSLLALCGGLRGRNLIVMGGMLSEIRKGDKKKSKGTI